MKKDWLKNLKHGDKVKYVKKSSVHNRAWKFTVGKEYTVRYKKGLHIVPEVDDDKGMSLCLWKSDEDWTSGFEAVPNNDHLMQCGLCGNMYEEGSTEEAKFITTFKKAHNKLVKNRGLLFSMVILLKMQSTCDDYMKGTVKPRKGKYVTCNTCSTQLGYQAIKDIKEEMNL